MPFSQTPRLMQEEKKLSGSKMKAAVDQQLATFKTAAPPVPAK